MLLLRAEDCSRNAFIELTVAGCLSACCWTFAISTELHQSAAERDWTSVACSKRGSLQRSRMVCEKQIKTLRLQQTVLSGF
jgi:hypothetical protein